MFACLQQYFLSGCAVHIFVILLIVSLSIKYGAEHMLRTLLLRHTRVLVANDARRRHILLRCTYGTCVIARFNVCVGQTTMCDSDRSTCAHALRTRQIVAERNQSVSMSICKE